MCLVNGPQYKCIYFKYFKQRKINCFQKGSTDWTWCKKQLESGRDHREEGKKQLLPWEAFGQAELGQPGIRFSLGEEKA